MTLACGVTDAEIRRFLDGGAVELEHHVGTCEHCQATLEEVWSDAFEGDLSPAVLRTLEFDQFVMDAAEMAAGVGARMVHALMVYLGAQEEADR
jgi:hypothetical protein